MWDDSVAPETTIDFDAPHTPISQVLTIFFGFVGFLGSVMLGVYISDPEGNNPAAPRKDILDSNQILHDIGLGHFAVAASTDEHDDE